MDMTFNFAEESKQLENLEVKENWAFCDIGGFDKIPQYVMENKDINLKCPSKIFLHKALNLTGAEMSFNTVSNNKEYLGKHKHKENEEIIIVLSGEGYVLIDNQEIEVKEGSIVKIGTGLVRAIKSIENGSLTYICIQTKANSLTSYTLTDAEMV